MSLKSIKKTDHKQPIQRLSIDEIISMVANFDNNTKNKNLEESKTKKPNSVAQIQKEKLVTLLETIGKLKDAVIRRDESNVSKIQELYKLLKTKLGNDLYLLNINILVKFLHGNKITNANPLAPPIKVLFDTILTDVDGELKSLLPDYDYNLLVDLFNHETEPNFQKIINSSGISKTFEEENEVNKKALSLIYIYIVLTILTRADFYKELFIIERVLAEHITEFETKDSNTFLLKLLPEALIDGNPKTKIRSSVHLYLTTHNRELKKDVDKLDYYRNLSEKLSEEVKQLTEQGKEKDISISQLIKEGLEKDNAITNLQADLNETNNRLVYEKNKYEKQLQGFKKGIYSNIQRNTKIVIDDISFIASRVPEKESNELHAWILNLKEYFELLGKIN